MVRRVKKYAVIVHDDVIAVGEAEGKKGIEVLDSLVELIEWSMDDGEEK